MQHIMYISVGLFPSEAFAEISVFTASDTLTKNGTEGQKDLQQPTIFFWLSFISSILSSISDLRLDISLSLSDISDSLLSLSSSISCNISLALFLLGRDWRDFLRRFGALAALLAGARPPPPPPLG